jgi:hypothetical protein
MGKKIVSSSNLLLLRWEIFLCWDVLKGQCVMLIKWENFGAFFVLTSEAGNFLNWGRLKRVLLYFVKLWIQPNILEKFL